MQLISRAGLVWQVSKDMQCHSNNWDTCGKAMATKRKIPQ